MSDTSCALVIERNGKTPLVITSESYLMLSKFKDKLDAKIKDRPIKTSIVGPMDLEDFMSVEEIVTEFSQV